MHKLKCVVRAEPKDTADEEHITEWTTDSYPDVNAIKNLLPGYDIYVHIAGTMGFIKV